MKRLIILLLVFAMVLPCAALMTQENDAADTADVPEDEVVMVSSEARPLKYGDKGDEVRSLQTRLKDVRYYNAKVTGNYLGSTRDAVKKVQEAYGLKVTGDADSETLQIIYGDCLRPLKKGIEGKDVSRLQTRLSELGYYTGKISGKFLDGTVKAIAAFQKANGLKETGAADVQTQQKLYSDDVVMPTPDPNATATPVPAPTPTPDLTYPGKLSYGSKGKRVQQVQERLKELGYFTRKTTVGFYRHTQEALQRFQKQNGLPGEGIVDEDTWKALYAEDVARPKDPPKPSPVPTPPPYKLEVDVTNQLIKIYGRDAAGEYTNFIRAMWCSTGTRSFPSKPGEYTLTTRRALWAEFPNWGGGKAQYWVKITPEIAFHSVIYNRNDNKAVNMKSVARLGKRASHGCIRLTLQDAKWIYKNAGAGTQVHIREDLPPDPELKAASKPAPYSKKLYAHPITPTPFVLPVYNPDKPPEVTRNLKMGDKGEDVFFLQSKLKELGFYTGEVTGVYREGTKKAVSAYQRSLGLRVGGTADTKLQEGLFMHSAAPTPLPTDMPEESESMTPAPSFTPTAEPPKATASPETAG